MLHKSDTADLFQETSPNPIKWAFLDEFSSESCISREKALKLTCPSVMSTWAFLVTSMIYSARPWTFYSPHSHTYTTVCFWQNIREVWSCHIVLSWCCVNRSSPTQTVPRSTHQVVAFVSVQQSKQLQIQIVLSRLNAFTNISCVQHPFVESGKTQVQDADVCCRYFTLYCALL